MRDEDFIAAWEEERPSPSQRLLIELRGLPTGWAGPNSVQPNEKCIDDLAAFLKVATPEFEEIEIDPITGSLTGVWYVGPARVSANFAGDGFVGMICGDASVRRIDISEVDAVKTALEVISSGAASPASA